MSFLVAGSILFTVGQRHPGSFRGFVLLVETVILQTAGICGQRQAAIRLTVTQHTHHHQTSQNHCRHSLHTLKHNYFSFFLCILFPSIGGWMTMFCALRISWHFRHTPSEPGQGSSEAHQQWISPFATSLYCFVLCSFTIPLFAQEKVTCQATNVHNMKKKERKLPLLPFLLHIRTKTHPPAKPVVVI